MINNGEHPGILYGEKELQNGENLFSKESMQNAPFKEPRMIKRAKRLTSEPIKSDKVKLIVSADRLPFTKNSKHSRNGKRGLAKKGGSGGKGAWGLLGTEINEEEFIDQYDPNYDSDSAADAVKFVSISPAVLMDDEEIREQIVNVLKEYFEHTNMRDTIDSLEELNIIKTKAYMIIVQIVSIAIDRHGPQRELASRLISEISIESLNEEDVRKGLNDLLESVSDLIIDVPEAAEMLGCFIARAIADDCIPPAFIKNLKGKVESKEAVAALLKADNLLGMKHGIVRLDNVWGVGGGNKPVKALKKRIALLLKEYLNSNDLVEATRCLKELDVPHFYHEFVYDAMVLAIENSTDRDAESISDLLKYLHSTLIVPHNEMEKGIKQVFDNMEEICIDVPAAYVLLEHLATKLRTRKVMSSKLFEELPNRGRKRFVSEGDYGILKW